MSPVSPMWRKFLQYRDGYPGQIAERRASIGVWSLAHVVGPAQFRADLTVATQCGVAGVVRFTLNRRQSWVRAYEANRAR